jgi:myo-inositol-1(or 4)-monophosphatase
MHGLPHFSVAISLRKGDDAILAAVFDPYYNELFTAEKGRGASLNGKKICVSDVHKLEKSIICVLIDAAGVADIEPGVQYYRKILKEAGDIRRIGLTALEMCYIACGRIEGHVNNHSDFFSVSAGKPILDEAGLLTSTVSLGE